MRVVKAISKRQNPIYLLLVVMCLTVPVEVNAMGAGWGDFGGGSDSPSNTVCAPDEAPVIKPGPFGSPLRIVPFNSGAYLIADYTEKSVFHLDASNSPIRFIEADGRPLSIAIKPQTTHMVTEKVTSTIYETFVVQKEVVVPAQTARRGADKKISASSQGAVASFIRDLGAIPNGLGENISTREASRLLSSIESQIKDQFGIIGSETNRFYATFSLSDKARVLIHALESYQPKQRSGSGVSKLVPVEIRRPVTNTVTQQVQKVFGANYFVGNDDDRTIDVYVESQGGLTLAEKLFQGKGVQALDMVYVESLQWLFVVDGLTGTVKVLGSGSPNPVLTIGDFDQLKNPKGLAVDAAAGQIFVTDYGDPRVGIEASIKVFDLSGGLLKTLSGAFSRPQGITVTADKIYMVDAMLGKVLEFNRSTGAQVADYGCSGSSAGHMLLPMDVTLDATGENLHVADNRNMRITVLPLNTGL